MKDADKTDEQPICIESRGSSAELESPKAEHIKKGRLPELRGK